MSPGEEEYCYPAKSVITYAIEDRINELEKQVFDLASELHRAHMKIEMLQAKALQVRGLVKKVTD